MTLHLSLKNFLNVVIGVCVLCLALIPLLVSADQLAWTRWKLTVVIAAVVAVIALFGQAFRQSSEDNKQTEILKSLLERMPTPTVASIPDVAPVDKHEYSDWNQLSERFRQLDSKPIPIEAEWIQNLETKNYDWWVRGVSEVGTRLCIEMCKEAGRGLLAIPSFSKQFSEIATVNDDGDRWLLAISKIAKIGKVTANLRSSEHGKVTEAQGGRIDDLPGASQVLCQMAANGFRQ
jgi:hypothetical protein